MRILFLGAGATGGYFGGRMAKSGADITFLVREPRVSQLANGLRIESPAGNSEVNVRTITAADPTEPFDVIVLTCKAFGLEGALDAISSQVRDSTVVLPLLNGFRHLKHIEARFPNVVVWGGVAQIPITLLPDGTIRHLGSHQGLIVGPRRGQAASQSKAEEFVSTAENAGIDAKFSQNIEKDMWDKWIFLSTLAAGTCLTRSNVGEILKTDQGGALLLGLLNECTEVATKEGFSPDADRMAEYKGLLADRSSNVTASMLRDMQQDNPIEADHIIGDMVYRAQLHGIPTPRLNTAWTCLQCYENSRKASVQQ